MQESKWVKAEDLALGDEIRFMQWVWDDVKKKYTGKVREYTGPIVTLNSQYVTISIRGKPVVKKITTVENGEPKRVELGRIDRNPAVLLRKPRKSKAFYCPQDD
jgi:hypothetical protein